MSPIYGQLSDKPLLAFVYSHGVRDMKHNRDEKLNAQHLLTVQRAAGLRPPCRVDSCRLNYTRDVGFWHLTSVTVMQQFGRYRGRSGRPNTRPK